MGQPGSPEGRSVDRVLEPVITEHEPDEEGLASRAERHRTVGDTARAVSIGI
jgi:hypothetical protein